MSWGSLSQFSPNLQQPMPTMATLSRMASVFPIGAEATIRGANMQPAEASGRRVSGGGATDARRGSVHEHALHVHELAETPLRELPAVARVLHPAERHAR